MAKMIHDIRQKVIEIAGVCFWYWDNFYAFLVSCGIQRDHYLLYEGENKYKMMRNIITDLEDKNDDETLKEIVKNLYILKSIPDPNVPDTRKSQKLLQELKDMCGPNLIEKEIEERRRKEHSKIFTNATLTKVQREQKLIDLNNEFISLFSNSNHQQRGFELEKIIYNLYHFFEFEFQKPYKTKDEQIDGWYKYEKFDYLLEIKWIDGKIRQDDLAIFDKKIDKKARSTRGHLLRWMGLVMMQFYLSQERSLV
ncbi:MAG: hypothetical protein IPP15_23115 [Saprospiraceae bacterium]|uniref:Uncharacterized protein n=1 Tax=Candidatus Opimibacter skivensis TaxID=2982028 RepID=A0A9D7SZT0_9BACT|nr:hypothetical protein [Candidatus Opimibacter skivensis]